MAMQDLIIYIKKNYEKPGNELMKVILTFFLAFIGLLLLRVLTLIIKQGDITFYSYVLEYLQLNTSWEILLQRPWSIITYVFAQDVGVLSFIRLLFQMNLIYILGTQFINFFNSKHFFKLYIISILAGGGTVLLVSYFSSYIQQGGMLTGPSVTFYALVAALATIMPKVPILILQMQYVALFCILLSLWDISNPIASTRGIAQLAAMLAGYLYVLYIRGDITRFLANWLQKVRKNSKYSRKYKKNFKVEHLLDKIAKDGYGSLTVEEKKALLESDN